MPWRWELDWNSTVPPPWSPHRPALASLRPQAGLNGSPVVITSQHNVAQHRTHFTDFFVPCFVLKLLKPCQGQDSYQLVNQTGLYGSNLCRVWALQLPLTQSPAHKTLCLVTHHSKQPINNKDNLNLEGRKEYIVMENPTQVKNLKQGRRFTDSCAVKSEINSKNMSKHNKTVQLKMWFHLSSGVKLIYAFLIVKLWNWDVSSHCQKSMQSSQLWFGQNHRPKRVDVWSDRSSRPGDRK